MGWVECIDREPPDGGKYLVRRFPGIDDHCWWVLPFRGRKGYWVNRRGKPVCKVESWWEE